MDTTSSLILGLAIFAVRFVASEATFERSSKRAGVSKYRPVFGIRLTFGMGIPIFLIGAFQIATQGHLREDWSSLAIFLVLASGMIVFWPRTIAITSAGISELRWFGLKAVGFAWSDVEYAAREADANIRVIAKNGTSITHTRYHVDPLGFVAEVGKYCKVF